jgi:hypothetical protein
MGRMGCSFRSLRICYCSYHCCIGTTLSASCNFKYRLCHYNYYMEEGEKGEEKLKRCPICGCTEHRLIGCGRHWAKHKARPDSRCEQRHFNS